VHKLQRILLTAPSGAGAAFECTKSPGSCNCASKQADVDSVESNSSELGCGGSLCPDDPSQTCAMKMAGTAQMMRAKLRQIWFRVGAQLFESKLVAGGK
jgi:hypothetical protein